VSQNRGEALRGGGEKKEVQSEVTEWQKEEAQEKKKGKDLLNVMNLAGISLLGFPRLERNDRKV